MLTHHAALWIRGRSGDEHAVHIISRDNAGHYLVRLLVAELTLRGFTTRSSTWRSGSDNHAHGYESDPPPMDWDTAPW